MPFALESSSSRTLTPTSNRPNRPQRAGLLLSGFLVATYFSAMPALGLPLESDLSATPLVLKDGRIARVSIHTIPFPDQAAALASTTARELQRFTKTMATDCFLTAQVIGHVDQAEKGGRDTADIHRLARARADTIQATLIASGLPAASIASVWDWQFMVQEAKATLWIFRLAAGDDCHDEALDPMSGDKIAAVGHETESLNAGLNATSPSPTKPESVRKDVVATAGTSSAEVTRPVPAAVVKRQDVIASKQEVKPVAAAMSRAPRQLAAVMPTQGDVAKEGHVAIKDNRTLEITFATNSSYLPQGAKDPMGNFLRQLDQGSSYVLRLQTSIDGDPSKAASPAEAEAARYNQWLADRRFQRVKDWLLKNSQGSHLEIEPGEAIDDGSRRVIVEVAPRR